jgi:uncharacterized membrane protein
MYLTSFVSYLNLLEAFLGPMLFVIYINDIPEMVESSTYLFADDTKIFREIREEKDEKMLQADLDNLQSWSSVVKKIFYPLNYFLTYFIPMHLMQKSSMWYFVKSFHKIHIY